MRLSLVIFPLYILLVCVFIQMVFLTLYRLLGLSGNIIRHIK